MYKNSSLEPYKFSQSSEEIESCCEELPIENSSIPYKEQETDHRENTLLQRWIAFSQISTSTGTLYSPSVAFLIVAMAIMIVHEIRLNLMYSVEDLTDGSNNTNDVATSSSSSLCQPHPVLQEGLFNRPIAFNIGSSPTCQRQSQLQWCQHQNVIRSITRQELYEHYKRHLEIKRLWIVFEKIGMKDFEGSIFLTHRVPELWEVAEFLTDLHSDTLFSPECLVIAMIYITRVLDISNEYTLSSVTWRPILFAALLIAHKYWDDEHLSNQDFVFGYSGHTFHDANQLELCFLQLINYHISVLPSTYAHSYFGCRAAATVYHQFKEKHKTLFKKKNVFDNYTKDFLTSSEEIGDQYFSKKLTTFINSLEDIYISDDDATNFESCLLSVIIGNQDTAHPSCRLCPNCLRCICPECLASTGAMMMISSPRNHATVNRTLMRGNNEAISPEHGRRRKGYYYNQMEKNNATSLRKKPTQQWCQSPWFLKLDTTQGLYCKLVNKTPHDYDCYKSCIDYHENNNTYVNHPFTKNNNLMNQHQSLSSSSSSLSYIHTSKMLPYKKTLRRSLILAALLPSTKRRCSYSSISKQSLALNSLKPQIMGQRRLSEPASLSFRKHYNEYNRRPILVQKTTQASNDQTTTNNSSPCLVRCSHSFESISTTRRLLENDDNNNENSDFSLGLKLNPPFVSTLNEDLSPSSLVSKVSRELNVEPSSSTKMEKSVLLEPNNLYKTHSDIVWEVPLREPKQPYFDVDNTALPRMVLSDVPKGTSHDLLELNSFGTLRPVINEEEVSDKGTSSFNDHRMSWLDSNLINADYDSTNNTTTSLDRSYCNLSELGSVSKLSSSIFIDLWTTINHRGE